MKKLYFLNEEEKNRILNMHKDASKKQYLTENKSQVFESRELLTENPIKGLRNIFNRVADWFSGKNKTGKKINLTPNLIDSIKQKMKIKLKDFMTDQDMIITLVPDQQTPRGIDGTEFYDVKLINFDEGLDWEKIMKDLEDGKKETPEPLKIVMKKIDYEKLGKPKLLNYKDGKFTKVGKNKKIKTEPKQSLLYSSVAELKKDLEHNAKIWRRVRRMLGVGAIYLFYETILWGIGYAAGFGSTKIKEKLKGGYDASGGGLSTGLGTTKDTQEWIKEMCGKENDELVDVGEWPEIVKNINSFKDYTKLKEYIENKIDGLDDIVLLNRNYQTSNPGKCLWSVLYEKLGQSDFKTNVEDPIKQALLKEEQEIKSFLKGKQVIKSINLLKDRFPNDQLNKEIIEKFSQNCPCIFVEMVAEAIPHKIDYGGGDYDILIQIDDYIYSNTCHKMKYNDYQKANDLNNKFYDERKQLPSVENIYAEKPESGPGSKKWIQEEKNAIESWTKIRNAQNTNSNYKCN